MDFEDQEQRLKLEKLFLVDEDVGVLKLGQHLLRHVGDEIGREIAMVKDYMPSDHIEFGFDVISPPTQP